MIIKNIRITFLEAINHDKIFFGCPSIYVNIIYKKQYKSLYNLMNKLCYFLIDSNSSQSMLDNDGNYYCHYQQMSVINSEIIQYVVNNETNPTGSQTQIKFRKSIQFSSELQKHDLKYHTMDDNEKIRLYFTNDYNTDYNIKKIKDFYTLKSLLKRAIYRAATEVYEGLNHDLVKSDTNIVLLSFIVIVAIWEIHSLLFPIYYIIAYTYSNWNVIINLELKLLSLEGLILVLLFYTFVTHCVCGYIVTKYVIPLYNKLRYILPADALRRDVTKQNNPREWRMIAEKFCNKLDTQVVEVFKNILLRCKAIESRKMKEMILDQYFGNDIGAIVKQYVPVYDYRLCSLDL